MADTGSGRRDLAAMLQPLLRALVAAELPVLARNGISMWGYAVLSALDGGPARTQAALAQAIGADKTRIIGVLDELQQAGLISREPDPADRRARLLSITPAGHRVRAAAQAEIQANEDRLLAALPAGGRRAFLRAAAELSARAQDAAWPPPLQPVRLEQAAGRAAGLVRRAAARTNETALAAATPR